MNRFQAGVAKRQALLGRFVEIGTELFAMSAGCARADALFGRDAAKHSGVVELADHFCRDARRRVDQPRGQIPLARGGRRLVASRRQSPACPGAGSRSPATATRTAWWTSPTRSVCSGSCSWAIRACFPATTAARSRTGSSSTGTTQDRSVRRRRHPELVLRRREGALPRRRLPKIDRLRGFLPVGELRLLASSVTDGQIPRRFDSALLVRLENARGRRGVECRQVGPVDVLHQLFEELPRRGI